MKYTLRVWNDTTGEELETSQSQFESLATAYILAVQFFEMMMTDPEHVELGLSYSVRGYEDDQLAFEVRPALTSATNSRQQ